MGRRHAVAVRGLPSTVVQPLVAVWAAWLVLMAGANLATPLYAVYAERFGFSSLVLTAIFAVYAFVLIPSLPLFGRLSDRFGRRPVMVAGLFVGSAGLVLFAAAQSTAWLFGARALQGIAVGLLSGPATAALVEFDSGTAAQRPALLAGLAQAGGSALGPALAGVLAQWAPAQGKLCFLIMLGLTLIAAAVLWTLPEPAAAGRERWRIQWPRVPAEIRGDFARVSVTAATAWGTVALYLALVPSYAGDLLSTDNLALLGAITVVALVTSCAAQIVSQRLQLQEQHGQALGLGVLALGLVALVIASPLHSLGLLLVGALAAGVGHGFGVLGAQDELNSIAPRARRGEVTAAFIGCIYLVVAVSVISSGLLDRWISLSHSVGLVSLVLAAAAAGTVLWQLRVARRG
jgi:MFS family permease